MLECPDPAQPADGTGMHNTRRGVVVAQGAQLVPVLIAMCEYLMRGASIRTEIEEREKERPQFNRDKLYGPLKEINDAWTEKKKALMDDKPADGAQIATWKIKVRKACA